MKKCAYCFSRLDAKETICAVCKIPTVKTKNTLTVTERKIAYRCRTLYTIGFLSIVGGVLGMFLLLPSIFFFLRGQSNKNLATFSAFLPIYVVGMAILNTIFPIFGLALRRYKKWTYLGGILLYSSFVLLCLPGYFIGPAVLGALFLYWVASPPSREILTR